MIPLARGVAPFGHPWITACSRLPRASRSVPRPSSPPSAKASARCPSSARTQDNAAAGNTSNPRTAPTGAGHGPGPRRARATETPAGPSLSLFPGRSSAPGLDPGVIQGTRFTRTTHIQAPPTLAAPLAQSSTAPRQRRPNPDSQHNERGRAPQRARRPGPPPLREHRQDPTNPAAALLPRSSGLPRSRDRPETKPPWRRPGSNRRPPACKAGALPAELRPLRRTTSGRSSLVGQGGLEPPTPRLSSVCSDQLSYWPARPKLRQPTDCRRLAASMPSGPRRAAEKGCVGGAPAGCACADGRGQGQAPAQSVPGPGASAPDPAIGRPSPGPGSQTPRPLSAGFLERR